MRITQESTGCQSEARALPLSPEHAEALRLLLRYAIDDTCSNRKASIYGSMLRKLNAAKAPLVRGVLEVSTQHLRPQDCCFLDSVASPRGTHATAAMKSSFGWLIYAHHERTCSAVSDTLWTIMVRARDLGCDYIRFDLDAPVHRELPRFDPDTGDRAR
jgi:hypothetical protein